MDPGDASDESRSCRCAERGVDDDCAASSMLVDDSAASSMLVDDCAAYCVLVLDAASQH